MKTAGAGSSGLSGAAGGNGRSGADDHCAAHAATGEHGYTKDKDAHLKRLRRIEGQVRGLQRMVDEDVYCIDVLTQVSASTKALQSFALQLLEEHLRHCVAHAAKEGGAEMDEKVEEATAAIARLLRT
ncbi:metal-sensitive transcriptional regulator [Streptomyces winkii]|uniref:metal-sensitive transcriptional regulator n=1 Tax=Streptomyces winkii TaxID=3051178 RepID=UPI0028D7D629|nr:metal-sensitive transcriptional regulator [Streptomyces sp. DSM 40971]